MQNMTSLFLLITILCLTHVASSQSPATMNGLQFEQYDKTDGYTRIVFTSGTTARYLIGAVSPFSGKLLTEECACTYTQSGAKISLTCECTDKDLYPDPIEDEFTYDRQKKTLTSTRYKYTSGSAPVPSSHMKFIIWNQKE